MMSFEPWEADTKEHLLTRPALHADETGLKVNKKNHWMHVLGLVTLKYLHRKRGKEAIDFFGIIPFYIGTLHWAIYFSYFLCTHDVGRISFGISPLSSTPTETVGHA